MRGPNRTPAVDGWRSCLIAVVSMLAASTLVGPDWQLAPANLPTILTFFAFVVLTAVGFWGVSRSIPAKIGLIPRPKVSRSGAQ
jgi:hypothetical protein